MAHASPPRRSSGLLAGMGRMLALGPGDDFNALVTSWFVDQNGRGTAYALPDGRRQSATGKHKAAALRRPVTLFSEEATYWKLMGRSEEHTSELQSLMRTSYAVFCLKKKNQQ